MAIRFIWGSPQAINLYKPTMTSWKKVEIPHQNCHFSWAWKTQPNPFLEAPLQIKVLEKQGVTGKDHHVSTWAKKINWCLQAKPMLSSKVLPCKCGKSMVKSWVSVENIEIHWLSLLVKTSFSLKNQHYIKSIEVFTFLHFSDPSITRVAYDGGFIGYEVQVPLMLGH